MALALRWAAGTVDDPAGAARLRELHRNVVGGRREQLPGGQRALDEERRRGAPGCGRAAWSSAHQAYFGWCRCDQLYKAVRLTANVADASQAAGMPLAELWADVLDAHGLPTEVVPIAAGLAGDWDLPLTELAVCAQALADAACPAGT